MLDSLSSPITETLEVEALLDELPIAVERGHFIDFVRGFPRKYLVTTPRVEIVKHYFLMEGLKEKDIISSLSRGREFWKLSLVTRDRESLFSRICGCLSCFGMDIFEAQLVKTTTNGLPNRIVNSWFEGNVDPRKKHITYRAAYSGATDEFIWAAMKASIRSSSNSSKVSRYVQAVNAIRVGISA